MNPQGTPSSAATGSLAQELSPETVQNAPPPSVPPQAARSLLDAIFDASTANGQASSALELFLKQPKPGIALGDWLGPLPDLRGLALKQFIAQRLNRDIARLDAHLNRFVNAILHHADFQKLEDSWRSSRYLIEQAPDGGSVKIRVLNVSWKELTRDLTVRALEFDQSQL